MCVECVYTACVQSGWRRGTGLGTLLFFLTSRRQTSQNRFNSVRLDAHSVVRSQTMSTIYRGSDIGPIPSLLPHRHRSKSHDRRNEPKIEQTQNFSKWPRIRGRDASRDIVTTSATVIYQEERLITTWPTELDGSRAGTARTFKRLQTVLNTTP